MAKSRQILNLMENPFDSREQRLRWMMMHAPLGLVETDKDGLILQLNIMSETLLKPVMKANHLDENSFFPALKLIAPGIAVKVIEYPDQEGVITVNEMAVYTQVCEGAAEKKYLKFTASKLPDYSLVIAIDDITEQHLRDQAMQEAMMERSVAQGKFEIASDVLHDIGNAIVGLGSYLTRIRRSLDQHGSDNLKNLAGFFSAQQAAMASLLGEAKAGAVVSMLNSLVEAQKTNCEEILQSVTEQTFIISHIQEILHIQRQYVSGQETRDRKPVNIRGIVNDCVSMQLASMEKRGIVITRELADEIPVIKGDRTKLMQVILNVLKNSIEAIDLMAAEKKISIRMMAADGVLSIQLKDNGCGFDEATGKQLFERGFTTKSSGTGLGLHNCRCIVESHDGTITIDSEGPGKGSVTTITFKSNHNERIH